MSTIYRCLLSTHDEAMQVLDSAQGVDAAYDVFEAKATNEAGRDVTIFRARTAEVVLRAGQLHPSDRATLAFYGPFLYEVAFSVHELTQESGGLAWDALTAVNVSQPCTVWLNRMTYGERQIQPVAPVRYVPFSDGTEGYVLEAEELAELLGT
ncbi:MAG TPA: hypothetical protein VGR37_08990 [Longimicrobiaceae bacterium]|nr:hypothetical protein [Longimicrobiaceae bacterium]